MPKYLFRPCSILLLVLVSACTTLPENPEKISSERLPAAEQGPLAELAGRVAVGLGADESAFELVPAADDAMHWRIALIESASVSLDIQYFIWKDDASGSLLLQHLLAAADRGVRVRLLVDDMFLSTGGAFEGADKALATLDFHPNVELRLFNPGKYRSGILGLSGNFGLDMKAYNRRMHNKLMLADGHFAVVGGRNIGDEYFGLHQPYNFLDLDVITTGPVVAEVAVAFDEYWNADLAYPAGALEDAGQADLDAMYADIAEYLQEHSSRLAAYLETDSPARLQVLEKGMQKGFGVFLQDDPVARGGREFRLYEMLDEMVVPGDKDLIISTPYLIPVGPFLSQLAEDTEAGVEVDILTNSLASNDATPAHSHYKKYRRDILATGAQLFELHHQPVGNLRQYTDVAPNEAEFVGLHVKASAVDAQQCFIGSLNMDPRSVQLNTENGLYIESAEACGELQAFLASLIVPENAWEVSVDANGDLQWDSYQGSESKQPAKGGGQRMADFFFRLLPIESQL